MFDHFETRHDIEARGGQFSLGKQFGTHVQPEFIPRIIRFLHREFDPFCSDAPFISQPLQQKAVAGAHVEPAAHIFQIQERLKRHRIRACIDDLTL